MDNAAKYSQNFPGEALPGIVAGSATNAEAAAAEVAEPALAARGAKPISVPYVHDALHVLLSVTMLTGAAFG